LFRRRITEKALFDVVVHKRQQQVVAIGVVDVAIVWLTVMTCIMLITRWG